MNRFKTAALIGLIAFIAPSGINQRTPASIISDSVMAGAAQSFDICMEDDDDKSNALRFNSSTGEYRFCAGGKVSSGKGSVKRMGNMITLEDTSAERKVMARVDTSARKGSAQLQSPPGTTRGTVNDTNTSDSVCGCR